MQFQRRAAQLIRNAKRTSEVTANPRKLARCCLPSPVGHERGEKRQFVTAACVRDFPLRLGHILEKDFLEKR